MIYNKFKDKQLSALAFGCMRLPVLEGDNKNIDIKATEQMVAYAMQHGINYYDTAWGYHGGNSEIVMGAALGKYPRGSFYLASKFPGYDIKNMSKVEEIFQRQLEKCKVDRFDFYLIHDVTEDNIDAYLDEEKYGIMSYLVEQRSLGHIGHLGFSAHGRCDVMERFIDSYGEIIEFCQIQLNWLDWKLQGAKEKVELLNEHHLPIWVMEPLRGGKLAKLPVEETAALKALRPEEDTPAWAFRFLQNIPSVVTTLSGMSNMQQLQDNIHTYQTAEPSTEREQEVLFDIADKMMKEFAVPCTACRYCTDYCPQDLDIPLLLELYNQYSSTKEDFIAPRVLSTLPEDKRPDACIDCSSCEAVCPQQIDISGVLAEFAARLVEEGTE